MRMRNQRHAAACLAGIVGDDLESASRPVNRESAL